MKESKEKEHRISNLKDMIDNVKDEDSSFDYDDVEEDQELMEYLKQENYDDLEIDDEFIYRPGDEKNSAIDLEENPIDENYIIKAPKEDSVNDSDAEEMDDLVGEMSSNLDSIFNAKIGRTPIMAFVSSILGLIFILVSVFIFQSRSDRVIDNVVSGETNFISVIVLAIGLLLLIYGLYKMFNIRNPIKGLTESIDSIDNADTSKTVTKEAVPKSNDEDNESYKIGEFALDELKEKLKKTKKPEKETITEEDFDKIPPAREKEESKKGLTAEEIEDIEYQQVKLDNETIDDIFAEVEDIDDVEIISLDSKGKKE